MCIQTPGSFVWAGSLAARLGRDGWSTWGIYVVTGCLQGVLLGMGVYYEVMDRQRRRRAQEGAAEVGVGDGEVDGYVQSSSTVTDGGRGGGTWGVGEGERGGGTERSPLLGSAG